MASITFASMNFRIGMVVALVSGILVVVYLLKKTESPPPYPSIEETAQPVPDPIPPPDDPLASPATPPPEQPSPVPAPISAFPADIAEKWFVEEGYSDADIAEAQALLREQGFPENRLQDPGLIRRHLLPRVVTSVQVSELTVPGRGAAGTAIPFILKGAVPTPEFTFVRFDIVRQDDIIRVRAIGHSSAFDESYATAHRMLPVELNGEIDPLPAGTYRILIPELGLDGTRILIVE